MFAGHLFFSKMKSFCLAVFSLLISGGKAYDEECLNKPYFGSKTPYKLIQNLDLQIELPDATCEAIHVNMVHRHGNRYPSAKDVRNINKAAEKINKAKKTSEFPLKLPWTNPFRVEQNKLLSHVGEDELYQLGKRLRARFPGAFKERYTPLTYSFSSSCKLRCTHSANALSAGLFEGTGPLGSCGIQPIAVDTHPCDSDPKLRFFEVCKKYRKDVVNDKTSLKELQDFKAGPEIESVIKRIESKLGLIDVNLDSGDIWSLFIACAYEIGMYNGTVETGICSLFDLEDRYVAEYAYDLKHFYKRSAGHKINYEISCPLLEDIVISLRAAVKNATNAFKGVFRSSHAETIMPLYALLGIYLDDQKLTAKNYADMKYRKFRSACISPFSGHLYFVLFKCKDNFKIQMFVNERLVKIPCCSSKTDCDFETFFECYRSVVESCHFKKMCQIGKHEL